MLSNPFFTGIPGSIKNWEKLNADQLLGMSGLNSGNFLFVSALRNLLGKHDSIYTNNTDVKSIDSEKHDYIAISASNWIRHDSDFGPLAELIESTDLPCLVVAIGAQANKGGKVTKLTKGTKRFLDVVSERSSYISVRGAHTQEVLDDFGIHNTWVTGCPSIIGHNVNYLDIPSKINTDKIDLSKVILQGTRHGTSETIFKDDNGTNINLELFRFAFKNNMPMLFQSEIPDICKMTSTPFPKDRRDEYINFLNRVYKTNDFNMIKEYLKNHGLHYWNIDYWFDDLSKYQVLIGTRIHGVISALLSGVPALLLAHDSRTIELARTMNIPFADIGDIKELNKETIYKLISEINLSPLKNRIPQYRSNFKSFFDSNNIQTYI